MMMMAKVMMMTMMMMAKVNIEIEVGSDDQSVSRCVDGTLIGKPPLRKQTFVNELPILYSLFRHYFSFRGKFPSYLSC